MRPYASFNSGFWLLLCMSKAGHVTPSHLGSCTQPSRPSLLSTCKPDMPCAWCHLTPTFHSSCTACSEDASPKDFFKAVLEAALLRRSLRDMLHAKVATDAWPSHGRDPAPMRGDQLWASAGSLLTDTELDQCVANAQAQAQVDLPSFLSGMSARGWVTKMFLLSTSEKTHYVSLRGKRHE
mmetsp:Transcript_2340/g.6194  ORF Transcript_2340/g.6194 Transcript_2340/m.6194 type:complete len:181 (+) Transcript_2340:1745-2287(+)